MRPTFFATAADFRKWLKKHHRTEQELWVGFYKKGSGRPSMTYPEAVDEALCYGWIDGVRKSVDDQSYVNRFTPRKKDSYWSDVNTRRAQELIAAGRMEEPGLRAFEARDAEKTKAYSFERKTAALSPDLESRFRRNRKAWAFWEAQPPGYRKTITWWVISAKREETRAGRLEKLIEACSAGKRLM